MDGLTFLAIIHAFFSAPVEVDAKFSRKARQKRIKWLE
jgi:hypothetical protein